MKFTNKCLLDEKKCGAVNWCIKGIAVVAVVYKTKLKNKAEKVFVH